MTLEEAKQCIKEGFPFGDVFQELSLNDKQILKVWYVREEGLPNVKARDWSGHVESSKVVDVKVAKYNGKVPKTISTREMGYTGDTCHKCQGCRIVRTGPCLRCEDCGETSGGCG